MLNKNKRLCSKLIGMGQRGNFNYVHIIIYIILLWVPQPKFVYKYRDKIRSVGYWCTLGRLHHLIPHPYEVKVKIRWNYVHECSHAKCCYYTKYMLVVTGVAAKFVTHAYM